jgi:hypothetical protein
LIISVYSWGTELTLLVEYALFVHQLLFKACASETCRGGFTLNGETVGFSEQITEIFNTPDLDTGYPVC